MDMTYYGLFDVKLTFSTYKEFRRKSMIIIKAYRNMTAQEVVVYKMYVYSRPFIGDKIKEEIWNRITGFPMSF